MTKLERGKETAEVAVDEGGDEEEGVAVMMIYLVALEMVDGAPEEEA